MQIDMTQQLEIQHSRYGHYTGCYFFGVLRALNGDPPPIFGTLKASAFSTKAQSWFTSVVLDGVLVSSRPSL